MNLSCHAAAMCIPLALHMQVQCRWLCAGGGGAASAAGLQCQQALQPGLGSGRVDALAHLAPDDAAAHPHPPQDPAGASDAAADYDMQLQSRSGRVALSSSKMLELARALDPVLVLPRQVVSLMCIRCTTHRQRRRRMRGCMQRTYGS